MTPQEKEYIHNKLSKALDEEKISQKVAEKCLGINQAYVSMIKLGTNLKAVPDKIWDRIKPWSVSCLPITDFEAGILLHQSNAEPERVPLKVEITTVGDFIDHAQKDLDQAQKEDDKQLEPVIPTFEEINAEIEEEKAEEASGQKFPRDIAYKHSARLTPIFEEIQKGVGQDMKYTPDAQKEKAIIEPIIPVKLETYANAFRRFQNERFTAVKNALLSVINDGDDISLAWIEEYNELWEALNL